MNESGDRTGPAPIARRPLAVTPWVLVALLTLSNFSLVISERLHAAAFGALASVAAVAGQSVSDALLARNPTQAKARASESAMRKLQSERAALLARNRALQIEKEAIQSSKVALENEQRALKAVVAKRAAAVRTVTMRTSTMLATRSAEAISTLPVRAVPYVGIAALVGFTSWELKADCDLARSLAELNTEHGNEPVDTGQVCGAVEKVPTPQEAWNNVKSRAGTSLRSTYGVLERTAMRFGFTKDMQSLQ